MRLSITILLTHCNARGRILGNSHNYQIVINRAFKRGRIVSDL